uniref:non-specific serine/threonine protein kinase n=1 Tax=Salix viminalis TaxID=40686 RepID=A0A6N2KVC7_SALVM
MASIIFLLLLTLSLTASAQKQTNITRGSSLTPLANSSWLSPSGLYAFGFFRQRRGLFIGVFVSGISQKTVVWSARRNGDPVPSNATLLFTSDGRVVLQSAQGGNFVLYNSDSQIIWQSFDSPTDTLLPTQQLKAGAELFSPYPVNTPDTAPYAYFASGTFGQEIILYSQNLTQNGNWSPGWSSTSDKCDPKGLCGLNSYCATNDEEAECNCLPGFAFVNQGNWTSGCERDFDAGSCKDMSGSSTNTMEELSNTEWEDVSYSELSLTAKDDCKQACLEDCNCEAALFTDRKYCRKQRLPLRFGRRNLQSSEHWLSSRWVDTIFNMGRKQPVIEKKNPGTGRKILIISGSFVAFGLAMVAIFGIIIYRYHVLALAYKRVSGNDSTGLNEVFAPRAFTYAELENITGDFKEEIGRGSFGTVYKGIIPGTQKVVAVKRLGKVLAEGEREFQNEMKVIGKTHHRNLVRLLGYCHDEDHRLPECETQIIHCDIKPQNILIDESRCPKVSDFGLAKLMKSDQTKTFTGIRGTRGYVAPEWHRNMPVTVKVDVYSFGDGDLDKLVDDEDIEKKQLDRMIKVGLWCTLDEPSLRPSMKKDYSTRYAFVEENFLPSLVSSDLPAQRNIASSSPSHNPEE